MSIEILDRYKVMTYYRTTNYGSKIEPVEFERVTDHYGFPKQGGYPTRIKLNASWETYHKTREQAVESVRIRLERSVQHRQQELEQAQQEYSTFIEREGLQA